MHARFAKNLDIIFHIFTRSFLAFLFFLPMYIIVVTHSLNW